MELFGECFCSCIVTVRKREYAETDFWYTLFLFSICWFNARFTAIFSLSIPRFCAVLAAHRQIIYT